MKADYQKHFSNIGQNLLRLRTEQGLSQQELANKCNVDRAKISKLENGRVDFMYSTLLDIADALGVDVSKLQS
ncbi:transcriptional regulator [Pedobacter sp. HMWF019]|uniref:helix-turn-helix domain-containing protein n=1 Tax=Pedobacter sp. HMWF019 TaxID=2056856 RepID=UPI000D3BE9A4|nr:helix-turn-helix transcriptional regulator [Pedobacter sp. HMWF019]PTS91498.1 transcriptional regulator [Pedobacter sp. HMWF019]